MLESPASTLALRNQLRLSRPGSYYFSAGGGLGFGLAAAVGVQLAQPDRPGRLRARRGLGAVRDHRLLERRRLRRPGHLPGPAQQRVRDPQVVRRGRAGDRRARPRPAGARRRRGRRRLRRLHPSGERPRRAPRRARRRRSPPRGRSWSRSRSRRACRCSRAMPGAAAEPQRRRSRPRARLARRRHRRSRCAASSRRCSAPTACSPAPATSSATPPTPAPTGCCPRPW